MAWSKWDDRFMSLAKTIGTWSSCFQDNRQIGAVIVKNKRILTTGYNGAPAGIVSCKDKGECMRRRLGIASGTRHELCYAIHAEQNAIIQAANTPMGFPPPSPPYGGPKPPMRRIMTPSAPCGRT